MVLDIDGSGSIHTTPSRRDGTYFDHDGNGFAESTGWIAPQDAFLAWDRNDNGQIDNGLELFGDQTLLRSGAKAASGLQALAEWDTTRDGKIDGADALFNDLRVWQDLNQDGVSQAGELKNLQDTGIASINLAATATNAAPDANGNTLIRSGSFTRADGSPGLVGEIAFRRDTAFAVPCTAYVVSDDIAGKPNLKGYSALLDLHQALAKEVGAGGTAIAAALTAYLAASDLVTRDAALDQLLYTWANTQGLNPSSRGGAMDARKIAFLEAAFGQSLGNPDSNAAVHWTMSWQQVREYYGASLLAQTSLKPLFDAIQYAWDDASQTLQADLTAVQSLLQDTLAADPVSGTVQLADFARAIKGLGAEDSVNYLALRETFIEHDQQNGTELAWAMDSAGMQVYDHIHTGQRTGSPHIEGTDGSEAVHGSLYEGDGYINSLYGHDTLWGTTRNETLINEAGDSLLCGEAGADTLLAGDGDDTLDGGTGNDTLQGEAGNDTYIFRKGSGVDRIRGWNAGDKIWLAANAEDVAFKRNKNDLVIGFTDAVDKLIVENYYLVTANASPNAGTLITFRDGSTWTAAALEAWFAQPDNVGGGNDILNGNANAETLAGLGGSDQIAGNGGNDVIDGGTGADLLLGAADYDATTDQLVPVQRANGDDTYLVRRGDGQDTLVDLDSTQNTDTLKLVGITPDELTLSIADVRWERTGTTWSTVADILIDLGLGDSVTLRQALNQDGAAAGKIERIEFDDGTVWSDAELRAKLLAGSAGADSIQGWGEADRIEGGAGNDSLEGQGGDDLLLGGDGADFLADWIGNNVLNGGAGDDYLEGGEGNNLLNGDEGDDTLRGHDGRESLEGGAGDDRLTAGAGHDTLQGGAGNDRLAGDYGDDLIDGGAGDDILSGGGEPSWSAGKWTPGTANGNDTYVFGRGAGHDLIIDRDRSAGNTDTIRLAADILPEHVQLAHVGSDLILSLADTADTLTVKNWFQDGSRDWRVEQIAFADGTLWNAEQIIDRAPFLGTAGADSLIAVDGHDTVVYGLAGKDTLYGRDGKDTLHGDEGQDQLDGGSGDDLLQGGADNDRLTGGAGHDVLAGGTGDDWLVGDLAWTSPYAAPVAGDDTYRFNVGDGRDTVIEMVGGNDRVEFAAGIAAGEVTVRHVGQDIVL
ncbi:MAG: hypothetical protein HZB40_04720, partial [Rhodocyclales bacterium]|nr:hypothetical protein [Rhodocyclales bacterium]